MDQDDTNSFGMPTNSRNGPKLGKWFIESRTNGMEMELTNKRDRDYFLDLINRWNVSTRFMSSMADAGEHPILLEIIGMGKNAIPFILYDWKTSPENQYRHWFAVLEEITGANPIPPEYCGNIKKMRNRWIEYLEEKGYHVNVSCR